MHCSICKDSIKALLHADSPFINVEERYEMGDTLLMQYARGFMYGYNASGFEVLLDNGSDILARDSSGRTCLHIAIMHAKHSYHSEQEINALTLLIQRGASIFVKDNSGRSIFADAYTCDHRPPFSLGSYRGDLWDAVLIRCGLGEHIWPPEERCYHYTKRYTEAHFKKLWEGWEHLYPYPPGTSTRCPEMLDEEEYQGLHDEIDEGYGYIEDEENEED
jgi:hypothetical protein